MTCSQEKKKQKKLLFRKPVSTLAKEESSPFWEHWKYHECYPKRSPFKCGTAQGNDCHCSHRRGLLLPVDITRGKQALT